MIQRLSSITLTFYNLAVLILLMGSGIILSIARKEIFTHMNDVHIFEWLASTWEHAPLLIIWLFALCLSAGLLFINALCCTLDRQLTLARRSGRLKSWLFFFLHCLFILVLACHGLILLVGEKESQIKLFPGQAKSFGQYEVLVDNVVFTDDIAMLTAPKEKQRALMTRSSIHIHKNYVVLTLLKNNHILATKKVMMLSPLKYKSVQITLIKFMARGVNKRLGVMITITDNVLNRIFFPVYGVMILIMSGFTWITWKKTPGKKGDIR